MSADLPDLTRDLQPKIEWHGKGGRGDRPPRRQTMGDSYLRKNDTIVVDTEPIVTAAEKLVAAIASDDSGGGLISRETIRAADELRVILLRYCARRSA